MKTTNKIIKTLLGAVLSLLIIGAATPRAYPQGSLVAWGVDISVIGGAVSPPPSGNFSAVAAGSLHRVAIRMDGTLVAWGSDSFGQLTGIPVGTFTAVAASQVHSVAIRTDGALASWGGDDPRTPAGTFSAVAGGEHYFVGIRTDGTLASWGGLSAVGSPPSGTFSAVAAGFFHSVAIRTDGTLVSWGSEGEPGGGRFGSGQVSGTPAGTFSAVAAGAFHSVAIRTDGTLASWGYDGNGQVSGTPAGTFSAVAAGWDHNVAIRTDGTLVSWGLDYGSPPSCGTFSAVAAGIGYSVAIGQVNHCNRVPIANAGADTTVQSCSGPVSLDGALSSDPDGDALSYAWYEGNTLLATGVNPSVTLSAGTHTLTLAATDPSGESNSDTVVVTVNNFASDAIIWHQPLARSGASEDTDPSADRTVKYRFKRGSTIPIHIHALGCDGRDVTSNANVIGKVTVFGDSNCDGAMDDNAAPIDFNGVGGGGSVMDKIGGHLKYNLDTKSLPTTTQCYILRVTVTDTSTGEEKSEEVLLQAK